MHACLWKFRIMSPNGRIGPQTYRGHHLDLSRSRAVVGHVTIRFAIGLCHFLLVVHWNRASISNRFRDIRPQHMLTNTPTNTPTNEPTNQQTNTTDRNTHCVSLCHWRWRTTSDKDKCWFLIRNFRQHHLTSSLLHSSISSSISSACCSSTLLFPTTCDRTYYI